MQTQGLIFNIQRYSVHDGPGIRTTVFLKGCPLRCLWCHNPEAISSKVEFGLLPERCIGCRECIAICPNGVHSIEDGKRLADRAKCQGRGKCVEVCYADALEKLGYEISVGDAIDRAARDRPFYETSQGGVTISGGEPLRQIDFTLGFLAGAHEKGLQTALDTCGFAPWERLREAAGHADIILFDFKHADSAAHRRLTGVPNELILENLERLFARSYPEERGDIWIRYPFVPGLNDGPENYEAMAQFLGKMVKYSPDRPIHIDILPYHGLAQSKYRKLGLEYTLADLETPSVEDMRGAAEAFARAPGLDPHVGG